MRQNAGCAKELSESECYIGVQENNEVFKGLHRIRDTYC